MEEIMSSINIDKITKAAEKKGYLCLWCIGDNFVHYYNLSEIVNIVYTHHENEDDRSEHFCNVKITFKNGEEVIIKDYLQYLKVRKVWENYILEEKINDIKISKK